MAKVKLSDKQREVLKKMQEGQIIHWMGGLNPCCFLSKSTAMRLSITTCYKLIGLGLVEFKDPNSLHTKIILTQAGKTTTL